MVEYEGGVRRALTKIMSFTYAHEYPRSITGALSKGQPFSMVQQRAPWQNVSRAQLVMFKYTSVRNLGRCRQNEWGFATDQQETVGRTVVDARERLDEACDERMQRKRNPDLDSE